MQHNSPQQGLVPVKIYLPLDVLIVKLIGLCSDVI